MTKENTNHTALFIALQQLQKESIGIKKYRSQGFLNRDYDMARITIDLNITEAIKLKSVIDGILDE